MSVKRKVTVTLGGVAMKSVYRVYEILSSSISPFCTRFSAKWGDRGGRLPFRHKDYTMIQDIGGTYEAGSFFNWDINWHWSTGYCSISCVFYSQRYTNLCFRRYSRRRYT